MNCMNEVCCATTSSEWKKGWSLKSGGFANLCFNCGSAYENSVLCATFHSKESGWRECRLCGKRIHCGCVASRYLFEYMDLGGVGCISCINRLELQPVQSIQIPDHIPKGTVVTNGITQFHPVVIETRTDDDKFTNEMLLQLTSTIGTTDVSSSLEQLKREESILKSVENSQTIPNLTQQGSLCNFLKADSKGPPIFCRNPRNGVRDMYESQAQPFSFANSLGSSGPGILEGSEQKNGYLQQEQMARHIFPKPPKSECNKEIASQTRVARPPAEGRGRSQLLPRYWPKITDQELQQISGDLKSSIVPLFEKILSASDAGRIGRLVLPKACAEAYFPPINQSEGIPIRIQDIKGKEWTFQFRFWPNNNSRMYVLEGVTPCIQNMQVQAGDTVTFSRIDPGGQLVIGCRKATYNVDGQDSQTPSIPNGDSPGETSFPGLANNLLSNGGRPSDDCMQKKKKAKNMKNKRHLMHNDDAVELRVTWEEAQELLRPSPASKPTNVMIEGYEFEEFEEPPVFGKRTIFARRLIGEQEQLAECDSCSKWRRLPLRVVVPPKWTCSENIWDPNRSSCSAPEDVNPRDLELNRDSKKQKISDNGEASGLDALASAAVLGDNICEVGESSIGNATTRHPRHRPGCTCIVCSQPPSGQNKHEPTCQCNVCLTVRRRFNTLMTNKKRRQSELALEREKIGLLVNSNQENDAEECKGKQQQLGLEENNAVALLDLNCDPRRDDGILAGMSLTSLMNAAIMLPFDMYLGQEGVPSLKPCLVSQTAAGDAVENVAVERGEEVEQEENREVCKMVGI